MFGIAGPCTIQTRSCLEQSIVKHADTGGLSLGQTLKTVFLFAVVECDHDYF